MKKLIVALFITSLTACGLTGESEAQKRANEFAKTQDFKDVVAARDIIKKTPRKRKLHVKWANRETKCDKIIKEYMAIENKVIARKASGSEALKKAKQYRTECYNKPW